MISTLGSLGRSAYFQLGENQKAIDDLDAVIKKSPQQTEAYQYRAIAHARLGHKDQARADLEKFEKGNVQREPEALPGGRSWRRNWVREPTRRWRRSKRPSRSSPRIPTCTTMPPVPTPWHLRLLPGRTRRGVSRCQSEPSACSARRSRTATPITSTCRRTPTSTLCRDLPAFAEIMKPGHLDRSYAAVWTGDFRFEASPTLRS